MLNLAKLNGITATIIACANCGLSPEKIAAKLSIKYGMDSDVALELVEAIVAAVA
jgi:hypothetical protein